MRGATRRKGHHMRQVSDFNPRSSCEERLESALSQFNMQTISIHAPHARSDIMPFKIMAVLTIFQSTLLMRGATQLRLSIIMVLLFQSTLLMRGATCHLNHLHEVIIISIHAPHARSDMT